VAAEGLAQLTHHLAAARRRPAPPGVEGRFRGRRHALVLLAGGQAHRRDGLARRRVDRFDPFARGVDPGAVEGARVLGVNAERAEGRGKVSRGVDGHLSLSWFS
jgi:hypothetical protein